MSRRAQTAPAEDERIAAWDAIAAHPIFAPCYATAAPLLLSMLDRLDGLDAQPAPQHIDPADVREGDRVRAEWGKVVIEGDVLQVRVVLGDVWASIGGVDEKNLTYCFRILLLDRPDPDAPLVETIAQAIAAGAGDSLDDLYLRDARAILDAIRAEYVIEPKAADQ